MSLPELLMVTTVDNPYDPFSDFKRWYSFDTAKGYNTVALLGRLVKTSSDHSEADQIEAQNLAVNEIVELNVTGLYRRVSRDGLVDR